MDRFGVILGVMIVLLPFTGVKAKPIKLRGYITDVESEGIFYIEDIRIVLEKDIFLEFDANQEIHTDEYYMADLRVGTAVIVTGDREGKSGPVQAESIKIFVEEYKKIKQTVLIEQEPHFEKRGDTWVGEIFADGQQIRVLPSTDVYYQPNDIRKITVKKSTKVSEEHENTDSPVELLQSLEQIGPNTYMTYEGIRGEDGSILANNLTFMRNELTQIEVRGYKRLKAKIIKEPNYKKNKTGYLQIRASGVFYLVPLREAQDYIQRIGNSLISDYQKNLPDDDPNKILFQFYIIKNYFPDAFAYSLPDGSIIVTDTLFDVLENEAQLAFILSHEIAHTVQGHFWQQRKLKKSQRTIHQLGGFANMITGKPSPNSLYSAEGAIWGGYVLHLENQADRLALNRLIHLDYDPREAPNFWKILCSKIPSRQFIFWTTCDNRIMRRSFLMAELGINYPDINYSKVKLNREAFQEIAKKILETGYKKSRNPYY